MSEQDPELPQEPAETDQEVTALGRAALQRREQFRPTQELTPWEQLKHEDFWQDIQLRRMYATRMLWILGLELVFVNLMFLLYAWKGVHWNVPGTTMQVWLSATVVQVVGIVYVVTRYLFPPRSYRN